MKPAVIFVVDDDAAVAHALKFALELEGFAVDTFGDAESVLRLGAFPSAGCLVVDYNLPARNGMELIGSLRERDIALPAILITTNPTRYLRRRAERSSVSIVEKPLLSDALVSKIRALVSCPGQPEIGRA
ncbi:MAG: response regulator [Alphaproteobacteria bacterium]|nr:response regulator [Alphaproteobacteria bacterium]